MSFISMQNIETSFHRFVNTFIRQYRNAGLGRSYLSASLASWSFMVFVTRF